MHSHKVNLALQVVPVNEAKAYPIIDEAIAVIQQSGIKHEVNPFATVLEGGLDEILSTVKQCIVAAKQAGGKEMLFNMQLHLNASKDVKMESKTEKFQS